MIHHHCGGQRSKEIIEFGQLLGFKVNHNVPAQRLNFIGNDFQCVKRQCIHQTLHEVKPNPAHAGCMQTLQRFIGYRLGNRSHPASQAIGVIQCIHQRPVISTMAGCLNNHVTAEAKVITQCPQLIFRRIARGVLTLRRKGKLVTGAKHMTVRIHRAFRYLKIWYRW